MMATGYTHPIIDGKVTTLRDFALRCARAFGALVTMRDAPMDAPIPDKLEPHTSYHDDAIATARKDLAELPGLSANECDRRAQAAFDAAMASLVKYQTEEELGLIRLRNMQQAVKAWRVPAELDGLRSFMLEQLGTTLDRHGSYKPELPKRLTGEAWRTEALAKASRDLAYHEVERAKEIERTEQHNHWLATLRAAIAAGEREGE